MCYITKRQQVFRVYCTKDNKQDISSVFHINEECKGIVKGVRKEVKKGTIVQGILTWLKLRNSA